MCSALAHVRGQKQTTLVVTFLVKSRCLQRRTLPAPEQSEACSVQLELRGRYIIQLKKNL